MDVLPASALRINTLLLMLFDAGKKSVRPRTMVCFLIAIVFKSARFMSLENYQLQEIFFRKV